MNEIEKGPSPQSHPQSITTDGWVSTGTSPARDQLLNDVEGSEQALEAARALQAPGPAATNGGTDAYKLSVRYQTLKMLFAQTGDERDRQALLAAHQAFTQWIQTEVPTDYQTRFENALAVEPVPAAAQELGLSRQSDDALRTLTVEQAKTLTAEDLRSLGSRVDLLSQEVLFSLSPLQMSGLQVSALSVDALRIFSPTHLSGLQASQIADLSGADPASVEKLQVLLGDDIAQLPLSAVPALRLESLRPSQLGGLTREQMGQVSAAQMNDLTADRWPELGADVTFLKSDVYRDLSKDKVKKLSVTQVAQFGRELAFLSPDALRELLADRDKAAALTATALSALIANQKELLVEPALNNILQAVPPQTIARLSARDIAGLGLQALTTPQIQQLQEEQLAELTALHARDASGRDLVSADRLTALGPHAFGLPASFLGALSVEQASGLKSSQIPALDAQVASLSSAVLNDWFTSATSYSQITAAGVSALLNVRPDLYLDATGAARAPLANMPPATVGALSASAINVLGFKALSTLQIEQLKTEQFAQLSAATVLDQLDAGRLAALGNKVVGFPAGVFSALRPEVAAGLTNAQIQSLNLKVAQLSDAALNAVFNPGGIAQRTRVEAFTSGAMAILINTRLSTLWDPPKNLLTSVSDGQIAMLSATDLERLGDPVKHLARLTTSTPPTLKLSVAQIPGVKLSALDDAQIRAMTDAQLQAVTPRQIQEMAGVQVALWGPRLSHLSDASLGALQASRHVNGVTTDQATDLLQQGKLPKLSAAFLGALGAKVNANFSALDPADMHATWLGDPSKFSDSRLQQLSAVTMAAWGADQVAALGTRIRRLPAAAFAALRPAQMASVKLDHMTDAQLSSLTLDQLKGLTLPAQVQGMSTQQLDRLGSKFLSLPDSIITGVDLAKFSDRMFMRLAEGRARGFTPDQVRGLSADRVSLLRFAIADLSPQALGVLTPAQVQNLSSAQVRALDGKLGLLTPQAFEAVCSNPRRVRNITVKGAQSLTPQHLAKAPLEKFTIDALKALTSAQLVSVTQAQRDELRPNQLAALRLGARA